MTDYKDKPVSNINPSHYRSDDIECIEVVRHMSFCQGNAIKYLWRLGQKDAAEQELKKRYGTWMTFWSIIGRVP